MCRIRIGIVVPMIVICLYFYSCYVYVYELCLLKITSIIKQILYLAFFGILALMLMVVYFIAMCVTHPDIPDEYYLPYREYNTLSRLQPESFQVRQLLLEFCSRRRIRTFMRKRGTIRYCIECRLVKPDRTHHCSTCRRCILKMDHHCPWLYNCVGFANYKLFVILLIYAALYCLYYWATSFEYFLEFIYNFKGMLVREVQYMVMCVFMFIAGVGIVSLLIYHIDIICDNKTTLEVMAEPEFGEEVTFDVGRCENFLEVCGYNWCYWCCPVMTSVGDGANFPMRYLNSSDRI